MNHLSGTFTNQSCHRLNRDRCYYCVCAWAVEFDVELSWQFNVLIKFIEIRIQGVLIWLWAENTWKKEPRVDCECCACSWVSPSYWELRIISKTAAWATLQVGIIWNIATSCFILSKYYCIQVVCYRIRICYVELNSIAWHRAYYCRFWRINRTHKVYLNVLYNLDIFHNR